MTVTYSDVADELLIIMIINVNIVNNVLSVCGGDKDDVVFDNPLILVRTKPSNYLPHHTQKLKHTSNERETH